jgi:putative Holliday junction resolvase
LWLNFILVARILAIDYGKKRTGLAVTDPLQIIANGLETVPTHQLFDFLQKYCATEEVETFVVGEPKNLDDTPAEVHHLVIKMVEQLQAKFPHVEITLHDERFTSKMASRAILESGVNKKKRQDKALVDKISAVIILQSFLEKNKYSDKLS